MNTEMQPTQYKEIWSIHWNLPVELHRITEQQQQQVDHNSNIYILIH